MNVTIDFKLQVSVFGYGIHSVSGIEVSMNPLHSVVKSVRDREGLGIRRATYP